MLRVTSLRLAGAAALLFAAAAPALAADETPQKTQAASTPSDQASDTAAAPVEAAKPKAEEKKICRKLDLSSSRLNSQKVCLTAEQWRHVEY